MAPHIRSRVPRRAHLIDAPTLPVALVALGGLALPLGTLPHASHAQTLTYRVDPTNNPLPSFDVGSNSAPTLGDVDGDGDLDLVVGEFDGTLNYFENTGLAAAPAFIQRTDEANPFDAIDVGLFSTPRLADLDGDGDLDLILGRDYATIHYFENTGTAQDPAYTQGTGTDNPFDELNTGGASAPSLADLDGDGDLDLVVGESGGTLNYFENTGSAAAPAFIQRTDEANPFDAIDVGLFSTPRLADLDGDGDLDLISGQYYATIYYFENTGSPNAATFIQRTASANPLGGITTRGRSALAFGDLDADGDLDLALGDASGSLTYFENTGPSSAPAFTERLGAGTPFGQVDIGGLSSIALSDLDNDGDIDAVVGESRGALLYFENTGVPSAPSLIQRFGTSNPFDEFNVNRRSAPSFGDLDNDGDSDVVVGSDDGSLYYFENTGDAENPVFTQRTGSDNVFGELDVNSGNSAPTLVDLDGDGDLDFVVGSYAQYLSYFENTGSAASPAFTRRTGAGDPFDGIRLANRTTPTTIDLDGDGDLDFVVGYRDGTLQYLENTGTASSPTFVQRQDSGNPFNGIDVGRFSHPALADLDDDLAIEAIVGTSDGGFVYLQTDFRALVRVDEADRFVNTLRLDLYPNPAALANGFTFEAEAHEAGLLVVEIYDALGRRVESLVESSVMPGEVVRVQVGGLASGVYFVRARQGSHTQIRSVGVVR